MLFMVTERPQDAAQMGERFQRQGRMLPEGVQYVASWLNIDGSRCFQIMEAANLDSLMVWVRRWNDIVDFEIVPVVTSQEYWAAKEEGGKAVDR